MPAFCGCVNHVGQRERGLGATEREGVWITMHRGVLFLREGNRVWLIGLEKWMGEGP